MSEINYIGSGIICMSLLWVKVECMCGYISLKWNFIPHTFFWIKFKVLPVYILFWMTSFSYSHIMLDLWKLVPYNETIKWVSELTYPMLSICLTKLHIMNSHVYPVCSTNKEKSHNSQKKNNYIHISYAYWQLMFLLTTSSYFYEILFSILRGVILTNKKLGLMGWLTDRS